LTLGITFVNLRPHTPTGHRTHWGTFPDLAAAVPLNITFYELKELKADLILSHQT